MGFSSQSGRIALMKQATTGVFPATFAANATVMKTRSGTLAPNRDLLITDPEIGGGRDQTDAYLGAISWAGDIEFYVRLEAVTSFIQSCLGPVSSATTTGVSTHTFTPTDSASLPLLAIEERIGQTLERFQYTDAVVNTLHFECDANGYMMGTAGLIAKSQTAGISSDSATTIVDNSPLIVGTNITITYNAVSLPAKTFSIDINNNYEDDDFRLGSLFLGDLTAKRREISGNFTIRPTDSNLWRQAVYGTSAATVAGGLTTKQQMVITCQTYEDIVGGTPATKGSIVFTMAKVALNPHSLDPSGDDVIEESIDFTALRPITATPAITVVVKSAAAAVA